MDFYTEQGYLDINEIAKADAWLNVIIGARQVGKTYGALKYVVENKKEFILLRRTQSQIDIIGKQEFSPFKALERDLGIEITCRSLSKYTTGFYMNEELIGIAAALSTFSNLRGFSSNAEILIFDEFIPERHERPIKEEGAAFMNVYETINRNRELKGEKALQVLCLANANDIGNPIFMELDLINIAAKMKEKADRDIYINKDRGLQLVQIVRPSPISQMKSETALYKLTKNSAFKRMALENEFIDDTISIIKSLKLTDYVPLVTIADCTIYKHKSERLFYMSEHRTGSPPEYSTASADIERFRKKYVHLWSAYLGRKIVFENKLCSVIFEKLW